MGKLKEYDIKNMFVDETNNYYPNDENYKYVEWLEEKLIKLLKPKNICKHQKTKNISPNIYNEGQCLKCGKII